MKETIEWIFLLLPALGGLVLFGLGVRFLFKRRKAGSLKVTLPGGAVVETTTLSLALILAALLFFGASFYSFNKASELKRADARAEAAERILGRFLSPELVASPDFTAFARALSAAQRDELIVRTAGMLRIRYQTASRRGNGATREQELAQLDAVVTFLQNLDPGNGHALYFQAQLAQVRGDEARFPGFFYQYISAARRQSPQSFSDRTDAEAGYASPRGFCAERIAWCAHLLAGYDLRQAVAAPDSAGRTSWAQTAVNDARQALEVLGKPFAGTSEEYPATDVVLARAQALLARRDP